jgi:multidrug efflux pump subunit AcrA (membrane-fusion protein)
LAVEHGDVVAAGDTLAMLDSPALDLEIQAAQGAYDTTRKRLLAVEATLLQSGTAAQRTADRADEFASEREELIQLLDSHSEQLHLLREQRQALTLNSPIAGQVITWDLDQLLRNRPVQRGQTLMTVADLSGPWIADLEVPDNQIGYVVNAQDAMREPLEVSFQLATDRSVSYGGKVRSVASRTDINLLGRPIATVSVQFDESGIAKLRPGATIFAKINCGRRSLGFVWFHQLIETLRGWALF